MTNFNELFAKLSPEDQLKVIEDNDMFGSACIRVDGDKVSHAELRSISEISKRDAKIAQMKAELDLLEAERHGRP